MVPVRLELARNDGGFVGGFRSVEHAGAFLDKPSWGISGEFVSLDIFVAEYRDAHAGRADRDRGRFCDADDRMVHCVFLSSVLGAVADGAPLGDSFKVNSVKRSGEAA